MLLSLALGGPHCHRAGPVLPKLMFSWLYIHFLEYISVYFSLKLTLCILLLNFVHYKHIKIEFLKGQDKN